MKIQAIKTRKFIPPKDDLSALISDHLVSLSEGAILIVTSKIVAIAEGACVPIESIEKDELIKREADKYLERSASPQALVMHTIKDNMLIASAGIDESNGNNFYVLWPEDSFVSAKKIWLFLRQKYGIKNVGVVITDSRLTPLRQGVVGYAIGYFGFDPIRDYRGKADIFGRAMKMETSNIPDSLASAAVLVMGEGDECQPLAVISEIENIKFWEDADEYQKHQNDLNIEFEKDMFHPFLSAVSWSVGGSGKTR